MSLHASSKIPYQPGTLCPRSAVANPGTDLVDRVIETTSKLNNDMHTLASTIADKNQLIKSKDKLIERLEADKVELSREAIVSLHHLSTIARDLYQNRNGRSFIFSL